MNQNPYESPQTIALAAPRGDDPTRDTNDVIRGSQVILLATAIGAGSRLAEIAGWFLHTEQLWVWFQWALVIVATFGGLLQVWGLWLMRRVPRDSGAKGLIRTSLAALFLYILVYWISHGLAFLWSDYWWLLGGYFVSSVFGWLGQLAMLWGFRRIGQFYAVLRLSRFALISFLFLFLYHGFGLAQLGWLMLYDQPQQVYQHIAKKSYLLADPVHAAFTIIFLVLYVLTLRAFKRVNPLVEEDTSLAT